MDLIWAKLLCMGAVFVAMLLAALLPLRVLASADTKRAYRFLSYSNCVAGGVFLGTCFISLFPTVKRKFNAVLALTGATGAGEHDIMPIAELTIMMGYFLMLFMEQLAAACSQQKPEKEIIELKAKPQTSPGNKNGRVEVKTAERIEISSDDEEEQIFSREVHPLSERSDLTEQNQTEVHSQGGHGHSHAVASGGSALRRYMLLLALSIHSVFEGIALGLQETMTQTVHLFVAIILHEILVAFAFGVSLAKLPLRKFVFVRTVVFFCIMIPIGVGIGIAVGNFHGFGGGLLSAVLQGLAAGTFIYVVFVEILPNELVGGEENIWKVLCVFSGFIVFSSLQFINVLT